MAARTSWKAAMPFEVSRFCIFEMLRRCGSAGGPGGAASRDTRPLTERAELSSHSAAPSEAPSPPVTLQLNAAEPFSSTVFFKTSPPLRSQNNFITTEAFQKIKTEENTPRNDALNGCVEPRERRQQLLAHARHGDTVTQ